MRTVAELMALSGRKALLTGGAGHIGLAVGEALVELGATVAVLDRQTAACRESAERLSRLGGGSVLPLPCDLADAQATHEAVSKAIREMGGLDILVHCAAFIGTTAYPGWAVPFPEQTADAFDAGLRVNLTSAFVLAQSAFRALASSGHGAICLISSTYGIVGPDTRLYEGTTMAQPAGYGASKGGIIQLTKYLATVMAPRVRVNCISPGGLFRNQPEAFVSRYAERTPLRRMGTEEDVIGSVCYLVSDLSSYVTGHNLIVDGGWTVW